MREAEEAEEKARLAAIEAEKREQERKKMREIPRSRSPRRMDNERNRDFGERGDFK